MFNLICVKISLVLMLQHYLTNFLTNILKNHIRFKYYIFLGTSAAPNINVCSNIANNALVSIPGTSTTQHTTLVPDPQSVTNTGSIQSTTKNTRTGIFSTWFYSFDSKSFHFNTFFILANFYVSTFQLIPMSVQV